MTQTPSPQSGSTSDASGLAQPKIRPYLLGGVVFLILLQMVVLSPKTLEDMPSSSSVLEPHTLAVNEDRTLAEGIPKGKIPEYSVDQFDYVSTRDGVRQWQILAERAYLFNHNKLVHARAVKALLFDPDGKITVVHAEEAKYFMNQRDLEVYGHVETRFPDGFLLKSEYLRYRPNIRRIEIPQKYAVKGVGVPENGQSMGFDSQGLDFEMGRSEIQLPRNVVLRFTQKNTKGQDSVTRIESDHCTILREEHVANFTMDENQKTPPFVKIFEPTMIARARRAKLNYKDSSNLIEYLTLFEDVLVKEIGAPSATDEDILRYATSGRADFDSKKNVIRLSEFPQVYQDRDTVTGDIIIMHRDSDLVEIKNSNAFTQGGPSESSTQGKQQGK